MTPYDLAVSIHPYIHSPVSKNAIFLNRILALAPIALLSIYHYGVMALGAIILTAFFLLLPTYISLKFKNRRLADIDNEHYYYALLFAMILPAGAPFYVIISGAFILNLLIFYPGCEGTLRAINPVAASSCLLALAFNEKLFFFNGPRAFMSSAWFNPFSYDQYFPGLLSVIYKEDFGTLKESFGRIAGILSDWHPGHYGELSITLIISALFFMIIKKCVDMASVSGAAAGLCTAAAVLYYRQGFDVVLLEIISHAFATMFLFYSCFLLTDYYSSPQKYSARLIYGFIFGALFVLLSFFKKGPDCANFSLAIASALVPLIDEIFNLGGRRE